MVVDDSSLSSFLSALIVCAALVDTVWAWVASRLEAAAEL